MIKEFYYYFKERGNYWILPIAILLLIITPIIALGGSIENLNYIDGVMNYSVNESFYRNQNRTINDDKVIIDADTIKGYSVDALLKDEVGGGGGFSTSSFWRLSLGIKKSPFKTLAEYFDTIFITKLELEELHKRMDKLEALIYYYAGYDATLYELMVQQIRAKRLNETIYYKGYTCNNFGCIKVTPVEEE